MTSRRENDAIRGAWHALLPALGAWVVLAVLLYLFAFVLPQSVGIAVAALLMLGPLLVWAFRRT